jgi:hypothetical protein
MTPARFENSRIRMPESLLDLGDDVIGRLGGLGGGRKFRGIGAHRRSVETKSRLHRSGREQTGTETPGELRALDRCREHRRILHQLGVKSHCLRRATVLSFAQKACSAGDVLETGERLSAGARVKPSR